MNSFLLDSGALLQRFLLGPGTFVTDALFAEPVRSRLSCLMLSAADVLAELSRPRKFLHLADGLREGVIRQFGWQVLEEPRFQKLAVANPAIEAAFPLIRLHRLGAIDGVVLQTALGIAAALRIAGNDLVLLTTNRSLLRAARREGLQTFNPERQTEVELAALIGPAPQG